jgi:hypothetical protein
MSTVPVVPSDKPLSQGERILDTFVSPSKTFLDLRRSSNWLLPFVLMLIVHTLLVVVADQKVGMRKMVENGLRLAPKQAEKLDQLPPDQREQNMNIAVKFNYGFWYGFPFIIGLLGACIVAGVMLGTMNFGFGAELTFNQCLAITMFASLPVIIKDLLAIVVLNLGAVSDNFILQNPLASNLSSLVDPSSRFLWGILAAVDVFNIWTLILAGIGYACLTKVKKGTCLAVVFGWWALLVLVSAGLGAFS